MVFNKSKEVIEKGNINKFFHITDERAAELKEEGIPIVEKAFEEEHPALQMVVDLTNLAKTEEEEYYLVFMAAKFIGAAEEATGS